MPKRGFKRKRYSKKSSRKGGSKRSKAGRESLYDAKRSVGPRDKWVSSQRSTASVNWRTPIKADRVFQKMRVTALVTTGAQTAITNFQFSGNSVFDPFQATGSIQPPGFDQLAIQHTSYTVHASSCYVQPMFGSTTTTSEPHIIVLYPTVTTQTTLWEDGAVQPYAKQCLFTPAFDGTTMGDISGSGGRNYCYQKLKTDTMFRPGQAAVDQSLSGLVAGNPSNQWFWEIVVDTLGSTGTYTQTMQVTLTYFVEFFGHRGNDQD